MSEKSVKIDAEIHRVTKIRASEESMSISDWVTEAIKQKLGPTKRERILDQFAAKPLLRVVCQEIALEGTLPSEIERRVASKNPKVAAGQIQRALQELEEIGAIKLIPRPEPPTIGDQVVYRRLEW